MFSQLLSQPPISLNQAKPGLRFSPAVESVVMRGLSKEPAKRYSNVVEFAAEFCQAGQQPADKDRAGFASKLASIFRKRD
jgi:serine/threonine-protein kinase